MTNNALQKELLARFRDSIDNLDTELINIVAQRFRITRQVGEFKAEHNLPPADPAREKRQVERLRALAADADLDPDFAETLLNLIISEVKRHHEQARK